MTRTPIRVPGREPGCPTACRGGLTLFVVLAALLAPGGCQSTPKQIFPPITPPIVWPSPPDRPRIRYIGELRGEASLGVRESGWGALREVIAGPRPKIEFSQPVAVAISGERVYVADTGLAAVHLLDLNTREYRLISGTPQDPLNAPLDVAIAHGDTLLVVDRARGAIDMFDLDGNWRETVRRPEIVAPVAIAWDDQRRTVWIADAKAHACFDMPDAHSVPRAVGRRGGAPGEFNYPSAVAAHPLVGVVVADAMNFRIQVLGADDQPQVVFGQRGDAAGDFARPRDVAIDSAGHVYVLDNQFENVQIFDKSGHLLMAFGRGGPAPGEFSLPAGISIDERDRIWVADGYNRRVQVFQYLPEESS